MGLCHFRKGRGIPSQENEQCFRCIQVYTVAGITLARRPNDLTFTEETIFSEISLLLLILTLLKVHNSIIFDIFIHQCYDHCQMWLTLFSIMDFGIFYLYPFPLPYPFINQDDRTLFTIFQALHIPFSLQKNMNILTGTHSYIALLNKNCIQILPHLISRVCINLHRIIIHFFFLIIPIMPSLTQNIDFVQTQHLWDG